MTEPKTSPGDSRAEVPGDLDAPDIVSPVGEEMPVQTHDEVDTDAAEKRRPPTPSVDRTPD